MSKKKQNVTSLEDELEDETQSLSENDICRLLDCILKIKPLSIEERSANYYIRLAEAAKIDLNHKQIRQKLRSLRGVYLKTVKWIQNVSSNGAHQSHLDNIKCNVRKMCPQYARLHRIFGISRKAKCKNSSNDAEFEALLEVLERDMNFKSDPDAASFDEVLLPEVEEFQMETPIQINSHHYLNDTLKDIVSLDDYDSQVEKKDLNLKLGSTDDAISRAYLHLESEKLQFERYKFDKLYELKKLEMEKHYELRKLEILQERRYPDLKRCYHKAFENNKTKK